MFTLLLGKLFFSYYHSGYFEHFASFLWKKRPKVIFKKFKIQISIAAQALLRSLRKILQSSCCYGDIFEKNSHIDQSRGQRFHSVTFFFFLTNRLKWQLDGHSKPDDLAGGSGREQQVVIARLSRLVSRQLHRTRQELQHEVRQNARHLRQEADQSE